MQTFRPSSLSWGSTRGCAIPSRTCTLQPFPSRLIVEHSFDPNFSALLNHPCPSRRIGDSVIRFLRWEISDFVLPPQFLSQAPGWVLSDSEPSVPPLRIMRQPTSVLYQSCL